MLQTRNLDSNIMWNHYLSQKLKLIKNLWFNYLFYISDIKFVHLLARLVHGIIHIHKEFPIRPLSYIFSHCRIPFDSFQYCLLMQFINQIMYRIWTIYTVKESCTLFYLHVLPVRNFHFFWVGKLLSRTWWVLNPPPHPSPRPYEKVQFELELIGYGLQIVHRAANMIYITWKGINAIYLPVA